MREKNYIPLDLIRAAKRDGNKKRSYLLVNPLQGKHVPVKPSAAMELFSDLGERLKKEIGSGKTVLVIAFAETATAIGLGLAKGLGENTYYIQTTRENVGSAQYMYFSETHSHATEQKLVENGLGNIMENADFIVFAEDEVTTGNTILHLIDEIRSRYSIPLGKFKIASVLNGMTEEAENYFEEKGIGLVYILKTDNEEYSKKIDNYSFDGSLFPKELCDGPDCFEVHKYHGYMEARRVVNLDEYLKRCSDFARVAVKGMEDIEGKSLLVIGTEEFMYPAMVAACLFESMGAEVKFHATTRSPILTSSEDEYPLHSRAEIESLYDSERTTYIYNLEGYDRVFVITDANTDNNKGLGTLLNALKAAGNKNIAVVEWRE